MATSTSVLFAIFFLLFMAIIDGDSEDIRVKSALDDLCENLGSYYITPQYCRSALCYDPSLPCSAAHNVSALAILATKLTLANATATRESIMAAHSSFVAMHNSTADDEKKEAAILSCVDLYTGIVPALQWVVRSVAVKQYHGAQQVLNATKFVSFGCAGMVENIAFIPKVLPKENDIFVTMAHITSIIIASLFRDQ